MMYRSLETQTVTRLGREHFDRYDRAYEHFVGQAISNQTPIPKNLPDDVIAVFEFCSELIQNRKVTDSTFAHVVKHFGERGVVDLMVTMSYYTLVCMSLNVDDYPLPDGVEPELLAKV